MSIDKWANAIASILATVACFGFAIVYHVRVTWWKSEMGRNLMALAVVLGALCLYTAIGTFFPSVLTPLRWVHVGIALGIAVVMTWRTHIFLRTQREFRNRTGV